jgi:5-oxopent-3-ene-1,2,5-tricarboxylate decarboxylase/2-hydroxyhepta-2,4-diene-1,7-dioate isomerase
LNRFAPGVELAAMIERNGEDGTFHSPLLWPPYKTPPKTAVWFIKPRNTVIGDGEAIPHPQGETSATAKMVPFIHHSSGTDYRFEGISLIC